MRHSGGWFKIHRSLFDHVSIRDPIDAGLLVWLIGRANYKESRDKINGQPLPLQRGGLVTSQAEIAVALAISRKQLRLRLLWLRECGTIQHLENRHGTTLMIENYDKYQQSEEELDGQGGWFKIHRSFFEDGMIESAEDAGLFLWLVARANFSASNIEWGLPGRGQLRMSISSIAQTVKMDRKRVTRRLKKFQMFGEINLEVTKQECIITILNYDEYSCSKNNEGQTRARQGPDKGQTRARQGPHSEEEKKQEGKKARKKGVAAAALAPATPSGVAIWDAYREAYVSRYRVEPVRNARTNAQCKQLAERLGVELGADVVRFYLSHAGAYYVRCAHGLGPAVQDAEGLASQFQRGQRTTSAQANAADRNQSNMENIRSAIERLDAEGRLERWKDPS